MYGGADTKGGQTDRQTVRSWIFAFGLQSSELKKTVQMQDFEIRISDVSIIK